MTETGNLEKSLAHTCVDFPHDFCLACGSANQDEPAIPAKGNPACHIPVLRADKGGK
jgi:hypothetical protein